MKVEVLCSINSGEFNTGDVTDLPKHQAQALVKAGACRPARGEGVTQKEPRKVEKPIDLKASRAKMYKEE